MLTAISQAPRLKPKIARWHCQCSCGNPTVVDGRHLRDGKIRSCGCAQSSWMSARFSTHGMTETVEYKTWCGIKRRCYNVNERSYSRYGGRGIRMSDSWRNSFESFFADMGPRPSAKHSIDRIDNDGPYSKENCRWTDAGQQAANRRDNLNLTMGDLTFSLSEWSRRTGIKAATIKYRIRSGWSIDRALSAPVDLSKVAPRRSGVSI